MMEAPANLVVLASGDNVGVALRDIAAGERARTHGGPSGRCALKHIPQGHKIAMQRHRGPGAASSASACRSESQRPPSQGGTLCTSTMSPASISTMTRTTMSEPQDTVDRRCPITG